jgi:hypothetical protein
MQQERRSIVATPTDFNGFFFRHGRARPGHPRFGEQEKRGWPE